MDPNVVKDKRLHVLIIGGGVAGLALAYGLRDDPYVSVRVVEKRSEKECMSEGYPIHVSKQGRQALDTLLTPGDQKRLAVVHQKFPTLHDGLTVSNANGKKVWRTVRDPGARSMVYRHDLYEILRAPVEGVVEYGKAVSGCMLFPATREDRIDDAEEDSGAVWQVELDSGEVLECDILIGMALGADGMFSTIRQRLCPGAAPTRLPWTTINLYVPLSAIESFVSDSYGINTVYGKSWSATLIPLDPMGDSSTLDPKGGSRSQQVYVALTVPSPSIPTARQPSPYEGGPSWNPLISGLDGALIQALMIADRTYIRTQALYTSTATTLVSGPAALIGDAAHGMAPFQGAGASCAILDALDLATSLSAHAATKKRSQLVDDKPTSLSHMLWHFQSGVKARNDPIIKQSRKVMSLAQGRTILTRIARRLAFTGLEISEKVVGMTRRNEKEIESCKRYPTASEA